MKCFGGRRERSSFPSSDLGCCSLWWMLGILLVTFCSAIASNCGEEGRYFWNEILFLIVASFFLCLELLHLMFRLICFCWLIFLGAKRDMFFHLALKFTLKLRLFSVLIDLKNVRVMQKLHNRFCPIYHSHVQLPSEQNHTADEFLMLWSHRSPPVQPGWITSSFFPAVPYLMTYNGRCWFCPVQWCMLTDCFAAAFWKSLGNIIGSHVSEEPVRCLPLTGEHMLQKVNLINIVFVVAAKAGRCFLSKPASPTYLQHIFACLCCRLQPHVEMPTLARHGTELTMTSSTPHRWLQPSILQGFGSSHTSWPWASGMQHHR